MRTIALGIALAVLTLALAHSTAGASRFPGGCNTHACQVRVAHKAAIKKKLRVTAPYRAWLRSTRTCEWDPRQRYRTNTGNGFYGAYQFDLPSWRGAGGRGMPHLAAPLEQDYRAVRWLQKVGRGAWPVCGR